MISCVKLAGLQGIDALLANADPCLQQDNADQMIDFAKSKGVNNKDALIQNAIAYRKHPRNALNINGVVPSTPFCTRAPRNQELKGIVNAQLKGVNPGLFGSPKLGIFAFGAREYSHLPCRDGLLISTQLERVLSASIRMSRLASANEHISKAPLL
jgi:hypothetical protein